MEIQGSGSYSWEQEARQVHYGSPEEGQTQGKEQYDFYIYSRFTTFTCINYLFHFSETYQAGWRNSFESNIALHTDY